MADIPQMTHLWQHPRVGRGTFSQNSRWGRDVGSSTPALDFHPGTELKVGFSPDLRIWQKEKANPSFMVNLASLSSPVYVSAEKGTAPRRVVYG